MPTAVPGGEPVPPGHPDRLRWNARYAEGRAPSFTPHPLAVRALALELPDGPVADLACGVSGAALLAAAGGRPVTAVDVSDVALTKLGEEAARRGLLITLVHADLSAWRARPRSYAFVLCTGFWDRAVFAAATEAVADGGLVAWEALTSQARQIRPTLPLDWCLGPGEPASLLPADFTVVDQHDVPGEKRQLLARRGPAAGKPDR